MIRKVTRAMLVVVGLVAFIGCYGAIAGYESPQPMSSIWAEHMFVLEKDAAGFMLGKHITAADSKKMAEILAIAPVATESAEQAIKDNPGMLLPNYQDGWRNNETGLEYVMNVYTTPIIRVEEDICRSFSIEASSFVATGTLKAVACSSPDGGWIIHDISKAN